MPGHQSVMVSGQARASDVTSCHHDVTMSSSETWWSGDMSGGVMVKNSINSVETVYKSQTTTCYKSLYNFCV